MSPLTREQLKIIVSQWAKATLVLERLRRERLRRWVYDWREADALLEASGLTPVSPGTCGVLEFQRQLRLRHRRDPGRTFGCERSPSGHSPRGAPDS